MRKWKGTLTWAIYIATRVSRLDLEAGNIAESVKEVLRAPLPTSAYIQCSMGTEEKQDRGCVASCLPADDEARKVSLQSSRSQTSHAPLSGQRCLCM